MEGHTFITKREFEAIHQSQGNHEIGSPCGSLNRWEHHLGALSMVYDFYSEVVRLDEEQDWLLWSWRIIFS